ncbi:MAG TPA: aminotransferase class IV [Candidatus Limnocylindrales bacterium]|nr:aminotransferase class IV [Candidatus Limnocylindrales bacterium]
MSAGAHSEGPGHIWLDGHLLPAIGPHISVFDRGFQLGDGIFETLRARGGIVTELSEHLARLRRSAAGLDIDLPAGLDAAVTTGILAVLEAEGLAGPDGDASVRLTVTRGAFAGRGLLPSGAGTGPTVAIQAWPVLPPPPGHLTDGLHLVASDIRRDPENPLATLKTTSRADYVHARIAARRAGADDALFLTLDGHLSEATSANLFLVRGDELATPHLGCAILPGTTRSWILGWAERAGLRPLEGWLTTRDLAEADEAFLCSSVAGILPVTRFEGGPIGVGRPGPITLRARADREAFIRGEGAGEDEGAGADADADAGEDAAGGAAAR